jgi:DNA-binding FadR family transcriptional regulator
MAVPAEAAGAAGAGAGAADLRTSQDVVDVHQRIVEAIVTSDRDLARHRLRRHLDALVAWTR